MSNLGNKKVLAENLNYYMNLNRVDRNKLCNDLGFKYTTVREWTNGTAYPRIDKIEAMANYFGILKSDLIEDNSKEHQNNPENDIKNKSIDELEILFNKYKDKLSEKDKEYMKFILNQVKNEFDKKLGDDN